MTNKVELNEFQRYALELLGDETDLEEYLCWVRHRVCVVCGKQPHAHHSKTRGSGGSDFLAIPLCWLHHYEIHYTGIKTFEENHDINILACVEFQVGLWIEKQKRIRKVK